MRFSFIIPTLGRKAELERCLASVDRQPGDYEVIVMDQNPAEFGLAEVCAGHRNIRHVLSPIKGLSVNRNLALKLASGDWIIFADDDCVLDVDYLDVARKALSGLDGGASIFFTDVRNLEDGEFYTFPLGEKDRVLGFGNFNKIPSIGFIFSRKAAEDLHGFDEVLGLGAKYGSGEDTDMLLRALGQGIPVLRLPGCSIFHPRMIKGRNLDRCRNYAKGYGALFAKHLLIQPWSRKPTILRTWVWILFRNAGGIAINIVSPGKFRYYWTSLSYKAIGFFVYLREDSRAARGI
jgi:glycosyltransferase involved in cell wall biosynthesis